MLERVRIVEQVEIREATMIALAVNDPKQLRKMADKASDRRSQATEEETPRSAAEFFAMLEEQGNG